MVRDGTLCLAKDSTTVLSVSNPKEMCNWLTNIGLCGNALAGDAPIQGAFYRRLVALGGTPNPRHPHLETGMAHLARGVTSLNVVTVGARVSFWRAFGIPPYAQIAIEREIETMAISKELHRRVSLVPGLPICSLS